jgi:hypothetical protein
MSKRSVGREQCLGKSGSSRSGNRGMSKRHVVKPWNKLSAGIVPGFRRRIRAESPNCSLERTGSPVRTAAFDVIPAGRAGGRRPADGHCWRRGPPIGGEAPCPRTSRVFSRASRESQRLDCLVEAAEFEPLHFGIRSAAVDHGLRLSLGGRSDATSFNRDAHVRLLPPRAESLGEFLRRCRGSNPAASSGQSVSNAYGIGSRANDRIASAAIRHSHSFPPRCCR